MAPKKVTLKYALPGTKPPLFVAGSFSDPAWQPCEMQYTLQNEEYKFYKDIEVEAGHEYQYKYRVGLGDWWVLNETYPTVTDDVGNRNNLLTVPNQPEKYLELTEKVTIGSSVSANMAILDNHGADGAASPPPANTALPITKISGDTKENDFMKPILVVEKIGSAPSYGDDFGAEATVGQKDAHKLRAEDAEPDYVVVRPDTNDAEVANVAAEVADSAAKLDKDAFKIVIPSPPSMADFEEPFSATPTPLDEQVPRFPHECITPPDESKERQLHIPAPVRPTPRESPSSQREYDPNDPNIEQFPVDRAGIFAILRETQRNLPEDETRDDIVPHSPQIIGGHRPERAELSPYMNACGAERAASLGSIPEDDDLEDLDSNEPVKSTDTEVFESNGASGIEPKERKPSVDVHEVAPESPPIVEELIPPAAIELPTTSFTSDMQQGDSDKIAPGSSPSIIVSPATPGASAFKTKKIDTAKASAIEAENGRAHLSSRKQLQDNSTSTDTTEPDSIIKQVSPDHERSSTPASVRATPKSKNFLKNFFQLVFVDWIGALIAKLCGGSRNALIAITALVLVTMTYLSL